MRAKINHSIDLHHSLPPVTNLLRFDWIKGAANTQGPAKVPWRALPPLHMFSLAPCSPTSNKSTTAAAKKTIYPTSTTLLQRKDSRAPRFPGKENIHGQRKNAAKPGRTVWLLIKYSIRGLIFSTLTLIIHII
jgi:hypothetical protein